MILQQRWFEGWSLSRGRPTITIFLASNCLRDPNKLGKYNSSTILRLLASSVDQVVCVFRIAQHLRGKLLPGLHVPNHGVSHSICVFSDPMASLHVMPVSCFRHVAFVSAELAALEFVLVQRLSK